MFIDANRITDLIRKYEAALKDMTPAHHRFHAAVHIRELKGLIDSEGARLDKMADEFEEEEYGQLERENAAIEKELEVDFNWPNGI